MKSSKYPQKNRTHTFSVTKTAAVDPQVLFFDPSKKEDLERLKSLCSGDQIFSISDTLQDQLREIYQIRHPAIKKDDPLFDKGVKDLERQFFGVEADSDLWKGGY